MNAPSAARTELLRPDASRVPGDSDPRPQAASLSQLAASAEIDFRAVVEQTDVGLCITQDGCFAYVNPKFAQMHGCSQRDLLGTAWLRVVHESARAQVLEVRRQRDLGVDQAPYESRNVRADGTVFDSRVCGRLIHYRGRPANLTTVSDISELLLAHRVAAWRSRMLVSTEALCGSGSLEIDLTARCVVTSAGIRKMLALDEAWHSASWARALRRIHPDDRGRVLAKWRLAVPGKPFQLSHRLLRADATVVRVLHRGLIEAVEGVEGVEGVRPVVILQDITEQSAAQDRIERLVNYHPVTGLATRPLVERRIALAIDLASRENRPVALLHLRMPELERVSEALGAQAGELVTTTLAARLLDQCRAEDTVGQLGNGEFVVLLDPAAGADESLALHIATRILAALAVAVPIDGAEVVSGGQIGIAHFPQDSRDAGELFHHAQSACGRGGAGVNFFTRETGESAVRRLRLGSGLRRAFERDELSLHYQPQIDLRDGSVAGVEALLRWNSSEFGPVSPNEFVPIAEEMGLIVDIGEWVFRTACEQSVAWSRLGLPVVRIGVNLSPRQLEQPDISQRLQSLLLETGADPRHLGIEVTESVLMRDIQHARRTLTELSAIGVEIALDDFGTGYSNLSMLRALPFDVLKIDRSLVHDVTAAPEDVSITRAVLMLAQGLKIKVLAEGVETEGQLNLLISNGCDLMQGYIFSRPVPAAEMQRILSEGRRLPEQFLSRPERQRTLLLVDDEESVLASLRRLLRGGGYRIVTARCGDEGLAKLAEHRVDVIISDQRMPGMTGVEFLRRVKALYPETVRIVLSGYTELQSITDAVNEGAIYKFLSKPWDDELLRTHVAEAFRSKELADDNKRLAAEVRSANLALGQANERLETTLVRQREQLSLEEIRALNAQDLLENLPTAVLGIDITGTIAFVNRAARLLIRTAPLLVGCSAREVLPADWVEAWDASDGQHRPSRIGGRACLLSCGPMNPRSPTRGHLISVIPVTGMPVDESCEANPS